VGSRAWRPTSVRDVDPVAAGAALGSISGVLLVAAGLHRGGHGSLCSTVRTVPGLICLGVFLAHLARLLGRCDPFDFASSHIRQRTT
jgi:hypothetical protein